MEKEIVFVTHNMGKIKSAEKYFKNLRNIQILFGINVFTTFFIPITSLYIKF